MDGLNDSRCISVANSDDAIWETLKVDLELNRANQEEQLQALKGKLLRVPLSKDKVQKPIKKRKSRRKKLLKKKAFWKALDIIKSLTSEVKRKRRCRSDVNFTVCCNPPDPDPVNNNSEDPAHGDDSAQENDLHSDCRRNVRDQVVQTEQLVVEDKLCQASLPQRAVLNTATANNGDIISPQIPVYVAPISYGVCMHSIAGSSCCASSKMPTCSASINKTVQCRHANLGYDSEGTGCNQTGNQFSLKQVCEQLVVQLCEKMKKGNSNGGHADLQEKERCSSENSSNIPDVSSVQTREIVDALLNLHPGTKDLTVNHMTLSDSSSTRTSAISCQSSATEAVKTAICPELSQKPATSSEVVPLSANSVETLVSVTPDLLKGNKGCPASGASVVSADLFDDSCDAQKQPDCNKNLESSTLKCSTQCAQGDKPKGSLFKIGQPQANRPKADDMTFSGKIKGSNAKNISSNATQAGSTPTRFSERLLSNVMKATAAEDVESSSMSHGLLEVSPTPARNSTDDFCSKVSKMLFPDSDDSNDDSLVDVGTPVRTKPTTEDDVFLTSPINSTRKVLNNLNINSDSAFKPLAPSATSESNKPKKTLPLSGGKHCKSLIPVEANFKGGNDVADKEMKVLSRVQSLELSSVSGRKAVNSPAFEELDENEMESVLVVWRQQELLHQDAEKRCAGVSKNVKRPHELPAELCNVKVIQPPRLSLSLKKTNTSPSVLDILDEEARKLEEDKDDDVSENSPKSIVQPSKKRKLCLNQNTPALQLVFEKSKESIAGSKDKSVPTEVILEHNTTAAPLQPREGKPDEKTSASESESEVPIALRLAKKKKGSKQKSDPMTIEKKSAIKVKETKSLPRKSSGNKEKNETRSTKADGASNDTDGRITNKPSPSNSNSSDTSKEYSDQIKERNNKLKKQWLSGKSNDDDVFIRPLPRPLPTTSQDTDLDEGIMASLEKIKELKDVSAIHIGKAHDMVVKIILNPWRGINAKPVTRGFVCPDYDSKSVSRALWDLRSNSIPEKVVESIMSLGWKDVHPHGFRALLSLFTLALTREVSFVIEANIGEDDTVSLYSDAENTLDQKPTPLRLVATKQIFKGECIEGLNGLLLKVPTQDKGKLRSWIFPKFGQQRDWAIFGPLAYLKRKESCANTMAVCLRGEVIAVKATRQILCGERLYVSLKELESSFLI